MYISSKPARIIIAIPKSIKLLPNIIFFHNAFPPQLQIVARLPIQLKRHNISNNASNKIYNHAPLQIPIYLTVINARTPATVKKVPP